MQQSYKLPNAFNIIFYFWVGLHWLFGETFGVFLEGERETDEVESLINLKILNKKGFIKE